MIRHVGLGALLLLIAASALADQPQVKKPWEWSMEERLERRFDPDDIEDRRTAYEAEHPQARARGFTPGVDAPGVMNPRGPVIVYGIDGRRDPELFLPHELLDGLLTAFTADETLRARQRALFERQMRAWGWNDDQFWPALESVSSDYIALMNAPDSPERSGLSHWIARCRARYDALQAARQTFPGFDALLYNVVAPGTQFSVASDTDLVARLRYEAGGCR